LGLKSGSFGKKQERRKDLDQDGVKYLAEGIWVGLKEI
jgi:hypothetical protein